MEEKNTNQLNGVDGGNGINGSYHCCVVCGKSAIDICDNCKKYMCDRHAKYWNGKIICSFCSQAEVRHVMQMKAQRYFNQE